MVPGPSSVVEGHLSAAPAAPPTGDGKTVARFAFVDGLRGLAALAIVIFHIWWYEPAPRMALRETHWIFDEAIKLARGGVQILLVVSGFVIAFTLRKTWFTPGEVCSFIGRRLVRLVPAYWFAIGVVIGVAALCQHCELPSPFDGKPSLLRAAAHMAFLQDIVGHESLGAGMWTLCIEMQFYLVAILGWGLAQRLFPRPVADQPQPSDWGLVAVFAPFAIASLLHWRSMDGTDPWVTHFIWMFFLGMSTWWTLDRTLPPAAYALVISIAVVDLMLCNTETWVNAEWRYWNGVALATTLAIFTAGWRQRLHVWLNWSPLQYLGRISYSLYLIHFPICHLVTAAGWKMCGNSPTPIQARMILLAAVPASLLAGHALYLLVEAPSARWAARMKRTPVPST